MSYFVIIRGPLGSGKTTIAKQLSEKIGAHYFNIDQTIDDNQLGDDHEDGYISQKSFLKANATLIPQAEQSMKSGTPVIFDGNFYWRSQIDDLINQLHFPHYIFTLKAPLETCIERDRLREKTHGEDAARVVYTKSIEFDYGTIVDATRSQEEELSEMLLAIKK